MSLSRRDFIQGVSAAAVAAGSAEPVGVLAAQGGTREPSGKVQIGIGGQSMGMFNNFALAGQDVANNAGSLFGPGGNLSLNGDGYPRGHLAASTGAVFF